MSPFHIFQSFLYLHRSRFVQSEIRHARRRSRVVIAAFFISFAPHMQAQANSVEVAAPASLRSAARHAYAALHRRDFDEFLPLLSDKGILISARRAVWPKLENHGPRKVGPGAFGVALNDLAPLLWEEQEVQFDPRDADDVASLQKALVRWAHEMDNMYGGLSIALHQMDAWDVREMGPSAKGKIASNYFWFMQFRREGKHWKIWKMELAEH